MTDIVLKRGMDRVEVDTLQVNTEILRRTFRVSSVSQAIDPCQMYLCYCRLIQLRFGSGLNWTVEPFSQMPMEILG